MKWLALMETQFTPRANRYWSISQATFRELQQDNRIWWGKNGRTFPFRKTISSPNWASSFPRLCGYMRKSGNNREAKQEITRIFGRDEIFSTPKPEATHPADSRNRHKSR